MGGYGAYKCALTYPQNYAKVVALSGVLDIDDFVHNFQQEGFDPRWTFGENSQVKDTENDLYFLLQQDIREKMQLPAFYSFCGTEDILLDYSRRFNKYTKSLV